MKNILYFQNGKTETFNEVKQFCDRISQLAEQGTDFTYQLNSSAGREYFEDSQGFYTRMKMLHQEKIGFLPLIKSSKGWVTPNLYKKLSL